MTEFIGAESEETRPMATTKSILMATIIHRPLKIIAFNADVIWRQRYELSKQLQDLHIVVALFLETHLKPCESF
jgi:hypothetical protein